MAQNFINNENFAIGEINSRRIAVNRINSKEIYMWKKCRVKDDYWFRLTQNTSFGNNKFAYTRVRIGDKGYLTHRVVYKLFNETFDIENRNRLIVAHLDGNTINNEIDNLYLLTHNESLWKMDRGRGTKPYGISGLWCAYISANGITYQEYRFQTEEEAHQRYLKMKEKYHAISNK